MPSKRKKNKRRMRRVQVQRRELEEQHAADPPIKSSTGVVVAAPPTTTPKKVSKSAAPPAEQIPPVIPVTAPTKVEPKPVEIEPVAELRSEDNRAADPDDKLVEQISAGAEDHGDVELEAQTFAPEAVPVPEPLRADETDAAHTAELVLETEPASEVAPPAEVPVGAPAELEIQPEEKAESEPTHPDFPQESEVKAESHPEEDSAAAAEEDVSALTPVQEAAAEPEEPELPSDQVSVEVEPAADDRVPEPAAGPDAEAAAEEAAPREQEEQEEHAAAIPAVPLSPAQDSLLEIEGNPLVSEKTSEGEEAPVSKTETDADVLLSSETNLTVEDAALQQETVTDGETSAAQTVLPDLDPADGTSSVSCADSAAEQKHAAAQSDSPEAEGCDLPCLMQLPVESAPLGAEEISVETALNGHIVPEVSIEG